MAATTYEIAFKLAGAMSAEFSKTFRTANASVDTFNKALNAMNAQAAKVDGLIKLRGETEASRKAYLQAEQKLKSMAQAMNNTKTPSAVLVAAFNAQQKATDKARVAYDKNRNSLSTLEAKMGTAGKTTAQLRKQTDDLAAAADRARIAQEKQAKALGAMKSNNATLSETAPYASGVGLAAGAGIMSAVKTGAGFDAQMSKVGAVSRASGEELAKLSDQARELGRTTVWSSSQAAEGMQFLAMAGFKTEDIMKTMPGMLDLASAGAIDLGRASDISSNILTGFGLKAEDMGRVGDILTNTFTNSNTDLEMLGQTMKYAAPIAKTFGASIETTAAMTAKLGDAGIQGEMAGTALRGVMQRLAAPSKAGAEALEALGVKTTDAKGNMREFPAILADLDKATKGLSESARGEYAKAIFETEAMGSAMILMEQAGSGALQDFEKSLGEAGSATRVAKQQNDNLAGDMKNLSSAIEGSAISIFYSIEPALRSMAQWAVKVATKIGNFAKENKGLVKVITFVVAGFAALAAAALPLMAAIKTMQFLWAAIKAPFLAINLLCKAQTLELIKNKAAWIASKVVMVAQKVALVAHKVAMLAWKGVMLICTAAQWALNAAMYANPIGLVIAAIIALIAIGVLLYKNWDKIKEKLVGLWSSFSDKFPAIAAVMKSVYENSIKPIIDGIKRLFGGLVDFVTGVFTGNWGKAWEGVKDVFGGIFETLTGLAKSPINAIISMINGVINGINEFKSFEVMGKKIDIGGKIPTIPMLAEGGIASSPTLAMIGEGRESEAVLPLSKLDSMLGGGSGGGNITVNFSPTINVSGGAQGVESGINAGVANLKKELEKLLANQRRVSYA